MENEFDQIEAFLEVSREWSSMLPPGWKPKDPEENRSVFNTYVDDIQKFNKLKEEIGKTKEDSGSKGAPKISLASYIANTFKTRRIAGQNTSNGGYESSKISGSEDLFREIFQLWPKQSDEGAALAAFTARLRSSSLEDVRKTCLYYVEECGKPAANPKYFCYLDNFLGDTARFELWLGRANDLPTEDDIKAWKIVESKYPDYPDKKADFAVGSDGFEKWRYHIPMECRFAFFCSVIDYRNSRNILWQLGVDGKDPENRDIVEKYTRGIEAHVVHWLTQVPEEYARRVGRAMQDFICDPEKRPFTGRTAIDFGSPNYIPSRCESSILYYLKERLPRAGKYSEVEKKRRNFVAFIFRQFMYYEGPHRDNQPPTEWIKQCRGDVPSDAASFAAWVDEHKSAGSESGQNFRKWLDEFFLELDYKSGQRPRPVVSSPVSAPTS